MTVNLPFDPRSTGNFLLVLNVRYEPQDGERGNPTVYAHAAIKTRGRWYVTGSGPQDAGWSAVERWITRNNRTLVSVEVATTQMVWGASDRDHTGIGLPCDVCQGRCTIDDDPTSPVDTSPA